MKFKGNNPIPETIHPDPDQKQVRYPAPKKYPDEYQTIEEANEIENDEGDPREEQGGIPAEPPLDNLLPFHKLRKPRTPRHNI
jgi:hypothetical protein